MSEHFRAFSFVDRIFPGHSASRIEGSYAIPAGIREFVPSLAAESAGQLAAWAAMNATGFQRRPIAGLAGRIELLGIPQPGQVLELAASIETLDDEAMAYGAVASVHGKPVIRLEECVGPMIAVTELDDPAALRARFEILCGSGATPGGFRGLPDLALEPVGGEKGSWAQAALQIPESAPLFADHFPRRPVFPGSLLMEMTLKLAASLASEIPPPPAGKWKLQSVVGMKLREFIPPGKRLDLEARLKQRTDSSVTLMIGARAANEVVGSARLLLAPEAGQ
jgi:3-hydroxymyristoyl/3-hydroxydecanoyl-(acyl carrier protein) dehydratase